MATVKKSSHIPSSRPVVSEVGKVQGQSLQTGSLSGSQKVQDHRKSAKTVKTRHTVYKNQCPFKWSISSLCWEMVVPERKKERKACCGDVNVKCDPLTTWSQL